MSTNPLSPSNWSPEKVSRGISLATRALFCGCCAYIVAVFQAVPASLHFQVSGTSIATTESQYHLGLGLAAFRIFTFLFGSGLGAATDRCGRKVWLFGALLCYIPVYGLLTGLWYGKKDFHQNVPVAFQHLVDNKTTILVPCSGVPTYNFSALAPWATIPECTYQPNIAWYYVVYIIMGIFTPYQPHAIGYISDISPREEAPANQSWLGAFGYYFGLLAGFIVGLIVFVAAGGRTGHTEADARAGKNGVFTGGFIPVSLILSIFVIIIGLVIVWKMDESIPKELQEENKKKQKCTDVIPMYGCFQHGLKNKYFMAVQGYYFFFSFGSGANESIALLMFQRWYLVTYGQEQVILVFIVYAIMTYLCNFIGAAVTTSCYLKKVGFKNAFHIIFVMGIPTVLVMTFALGKDDPSIALLLVILGVSLTSTGPIQPFIATLFMGQSLTDEDKGFYSGMLRSTQALGKALGSAIVGAAIGGPWIESWKKALDESGDLRSSAGHTDYWLVPMFGYLVPLVLSYICFVLGESCCLEGDKRGWESKDAWQGQDLYINCCSPGGLVVYQTGYKEKKAVKLVEAKRRASSKDASAGP